MADKPKTPHPVIAWREALWPQHAAAVFRIPAVPISSTDKAVAAAFAMFVGWDGRAYPSAETVAEMALMSERTVRQSLLRLEAQGYLRVISRGGVGGSARSLLREITTPEPPAAVSLATPEPPAAVIASTPEPRSTTPEADDATPEPPAAELEELDELVGDAPDPVAIAHRLVTATHRAKSAQIAEHIGAAVTRYGRASVTDALVTLESLPERFPWPEKLADAIDAHIAEMAHRRREKATRDMLDASRAEVPADPGTVAATIADIRTKHLKAVAS